MGDTLNRIAYAIDRSPIQWVRVRHERLSPRSSEKAPWLSVSQDGVKDDEELADASGERLFGGFSDGSEFLIVRGDDRVGSLATSTVASFVEVSLSGRPEASSTASVALRPLASSARHQRRSTRSPPSHRTWRSITHQHQIEGTGSIAGLRRAAAVT